MKGMITENWNLMRVLRLVLGIIIIFQGFAASDFVLGLLGLLFSAMALFNMGCCGVSGCSVPVKKNGQSKEINYEEVAGTK